MFSRHSGRVPHNVPEPIKAWVCECINQSGFTGYVKGVTNYMGIRLLNSIIGQIRLGIIGQLYIRSLHKQLGKKVHDKIVRGSTPSTVYKTWSNTLLVFKGWATVGSKINFTFHNSSNGIILCNYALHRCALTHFRNHYYVCNTLASNNYECVITCYIMTQSCK